MVSGPLLPAHILFLHGGEPLAVFCVGYTVQGIVIQWRYDEVVKLGLYPCAAERYFSRRSEGFAVRICNVDVGQRFVAYEYTYAVAACLYSQSVPFPGTG